MVLWATILILQGASLVGSTAGIPGVPENITVMFLNPTTVRVSWSTSQLEQVDKYDVTYKPTDARSHNSSYRVVAVVAGNSEAVTLSNLRADTQYQLVVTAVKGGKKLRSRPIVFRTLEPPKTSFLDDSTTKGPPTIPPPPYAQQPQTHIQIRGVEIGLVLLALVIWVGAIALFFNRWGKIRMLLPYQPDYKSEQLKVPGTGVCASADAAYTHSSSQHACSQNQPEARAFCTLSAPYSSIESRVSRVTTQIARSRTQSSQGTALLHSDTSAQQHLHWSNHHVDSVDSGGGGGGGGGGFNWPKTARPRVNSAIDVAGFLSQEFLRRHGSTSRLCRKVRSADNLPLASNNRQNSDQHEDGSTDGDRETFLKSNQDDSDKSDDTETRQNSLDNAKNETSVLDSISMQHQSSRDLVSLCTAATTAPAAIATLSPSPTLSATSSPVQSALAARRFAGWRAAAISGREYVRCPVRQPASVEERRSCEIVEYPARCSLPGTSRHTVLIQQHQPQQQQQQQQHKHARSCEYARRASIEPSVEVVQPQQQQQQQQQQQHFGLPILSVSEPSPPDEIDRADDYL
ncbi:uncharacterized protein LOC131669486 isoform X3 [Phymastichus coffea]|uniref:uncharacterized protein LOC131669486 isoform X3 n=1 Tax=Phymastichus coffea TaxID=108790 RepID=UPI00273C1A97|nr:uncharacterized protein LOC131669486 isoform X3 [Phymastichus coffea]